VASFTFTALLIKINAIKKYNSEFGLSYSSEKLKGLGCLCYTVKRGIK
jgi:hypothetical protein